MFQINYKMDGEEFTLDAEIVGKDLKVYSRPTTTRQSHKMDAVCESYRDKNNLEWVIFC